MSFHNPYHFVPVKGQGSSEDLRVTAFKAGEGGHVTHDRFVTHTSQDARPVYSGRLICRLTTEDPIVIGHTREKLADCSHRVEPFALPLEDRPAIPASTLRGLISSVAEMASNSAMRVLEDRSLPYRANRVRRSAGTTYDYFRQLSQELLPFHRDRHLLSIAEQLFGFVEQRQGGQSEEETASALASRLRFAFGRMYPVPEGPYYDVEDDEDGVLLKVLDTPKPPLPAFYFKTRHGRGRYIAKSDLNPDSHVPQGRKLYLHKPERAIKPWRTNAREENLKQKSRVKPIRAGLSFYFHVDFDNVSERELGLLCYAIRPTEAFRHKIGMGKPIGLGKVRLDPVGVFYIDRLKRYQETWLFDARRYHAGWLAAGEHPQDWPDMYAREGQEVADGLASGPNFETLRALCIETMDKDIQRALELLGDPKMVHHDVHTPQIADARQPWEMEQETYKWFVENDRKTRPQFLEPLTRDTEELPTLER